VTNFAMPAWRSATKSAKTPSAIDHAGTDYFWRRSLPTSSVDMTTSAYWSGCDLLERPRCDLEHEPGDILRAVDEVIPLKSDARLADVGCHVSERLKSAMRPHSDLGKNLVLDLNVPKREHPALGVMDEHDLSCAEQALRYQKRTNDVLADHATGVADYVSASKLEAEHPINVETRIIQATTATWRRGTIGRCPGWKPVAWA
jgi:hypothetical protein